jgi:uncharacterized membrane protein
MNNKKLGVLIVSLSVLVGIVLAWVFRRLNQLSENLNCFPVEQCVQVETFFSITHLAVGVISFFFALGIYLIFFSKSEEAILKRLEEEKREKSKDEMFNILLKGLDSYEQKILKAIREQPGITQNTLRIRVDLSKAKVSQVVTELEKKGLVKRIKKGKTLSIYFKENF